MSTILGQDRAIAALGHAIAGGRMHHAWLLAGPQGVGKAAVALAAARRLLAQAGGAPLPDADLAVPDDHPTARLIAAGSHPDFRVLSRLPREKGEGLARSITVAQVRSLAQMFANKPALSPARAVVIDAVDDLERGGANALLKSLEEPPAGTVFFLVSHAPGRLLPTIRSRCRMLRFDPLDPRTLGVVLRRELPEAPEREIAALVAAGEGSAGRALGYAGLDVEGLDSAAARIAAAGDPTNAERSQLARTLAGKAAQLRYEAFLDRAPRHLAAAARHRSGTALADAILLWERARALTESARALSLDPQGVVYELAGLLAALAPGPDPHG